MAVMGLIGQRRVAPRRRVSWGSFIALPDGSWSKCQARDLSAGGARVQLDEPRGLPASVWFLDMRNRLAYEARIAWQKSPEAGLEFLKVHRFADAPSAELRRVIEAVSH